MRNNSGLCITWWPCGSDSIFGNKIKHSGWFGAASVKHKEKVCVTWRDFAFTCYRTRTGPHGRFLDAGCGSVTSVNQNDCNFNGLSKLRVCMNERVNTMNVKCMLSPFGVVISKFSFTKIFDVNFQVYEFYIQVYWMLQFVTMLIWIHLQFSKKYISANAYFLNCKSIGWWAGAVSPTHTAS